MYASVRAFFDQIIDYAGLFPPAKLPLEDAVRQHRECATSPHGRLLRSFVCPTVRLHDLLALTKAAGRPLTVAALGQQSGHASDLLQQLEGDVRFIEDHRQARLNAIPAESHHREFAGISTYEVALPKGIAAQLSAPLFERVAEVLERANLVGFFEIPLDLSWHDDIAKVCQALGDWQRKLQVFGRVGLKLRCGGLTADAFPNAEQVAYFIMQCRDGAVRWKATAGLHRARRHWDPALQAWHHGFINVFAAGVLAWTQLSYPDLAEILADRELRNLRFEAEKMWWKTWQCNTEEIAEARANFATSFGSCSFEEPCQDLIGLGLLDP
jgi:hypothetical protein